MDTMILLMLLMSESGKKDKSFENILMLSALTGMSLLTPAVNGINAVTGGITGALGGLSNLIGGGSQLTSQTNLGGTGGAVASAPTLLVEVFPNYPSDFVPFGPQMPVSPYAVGSPENVPPGVSIVHQPSDGSLAGANTGWNYWARG